jgi:tetratricopeptide (TPR) repeat protein
MVKQKSSVSRTRSRRSTVRRQTRDSPTLTAVALRRALPLPIQGRVTDAASGQPQVRATVALLDSPEATARVLGQAVTDRRGQFEVAVPMPAPTATVAVPPAPRTLKGFVRVTGVAGEVLLAPKAFEVRSGVALTVQVPLAAATLTPAVWQTVAARMREGRLVRLNEIAAELLQTTAGTSAFDGLDLPTRYGVLAALEQGFVDPTGQLQAAGVPGRLSALADGRAMAGWRRKLASDPQALTLLEQAHARAVGFERLAVVDWVIDPDALATGRVGEAVARYQSVYTDSLSNADSALSRSASWKDLVKVYPPSDLSRYRDYLLAIFTGPQGSSEFTSRREKLRVRFHQTFSGNDIGQQPANRILHGIVKTILAAAPGATYGFGVTSIPPKGSQTDREYLDALIALSGISATEFALRYRLDLGRPDSAMSSVVEEQIRTLQGFYTDGFESTADPQPVIPQGLLGKAPFFLFYTEWLRRTGTFHAENFFEPYRCVGIDMPDSLRASLLEAKESDETNPDKKWLIPLVKAEAAFADGRKRFGEMQYVMAAEHYDTAVQHLNKALFYLPTKGNVSATIGVFASHLEYWRTLPMDTPEDLETFTGYVVPPEIPEEDPISPTGEFTTWILECSDSAQLHLCHLAFVVLPVARADAALGQGDFARAIAIYELVTRFLLGRANESTPPGWVDATFGDHTSVPAAEKDLGGAKDARVRDGADPLPYTVALEPDDAILSDVYVWDSFQRDLRLAFLDKLHPMERRFLRLRQGDAMLEWADALYRTEEPSSVQRAREVYKAVLFLHDASVGVSPRWNSPPSFTWYRKHDANPAWVSQTARARSALTQLGLGLNWHGLADDVIPTLRYASLKDAADRFAAAARSAQQDFLAYLGKIEDAIKDEILHTSMLKRARLQGALAAEQAHIAGIALGQAQAQVAEVQKAIEAKKKEIEESEDFFNQFAGFIGGMVTAITDLPSGMTGKVGEGAGVATGLSASEGATMTGAAAGGAALAGYGLFVYAGYTSLSNMADAQESLQGQLNTLQDKALPLAMQQVAVRKGELAIANLQEQIALADAELAIDLMHFQSVRFLNAELWVQLATVVKRLLRRYLALGARFAWLAERALAFEQNRPLDIVRLDYYPRKLQGLSGADLLQADLVELEAARLDGLRRMVPIRRTFSLAFDFPVQFAQLRATGRCVFGTAELPLRREHPGTFGHRIVRVEAGFGGGSGVPPVRGLLTNSGVSLVSREDGTGVVMVRPPESMPLGEYGADAAAGGSEALGTFEGSGIESSWTLDVPPAANPSGLDTLADTQITFDLRAHHSPALMAAHFAAMPTTIRRFVFLSLGSSQPGALEQLRSGSGPVTFQASLGSGVLPSWHSAAVIRNVAVLFAAVPAPSVVALLVASGGSLQATVQVTNGFALSNLPPLTTVPPGPASSLNVFNGLPASQAFALTVNPAENPGVAFGGLKDVVLGLEYEAMLPSPA